jgi:cytochrome b involved in lipid metabolism
MISIFLICETIYRKQRSGEDPWVTKTLDKLMTEEDFDIAVLNGQKLWILDDMVLDLSKFMLTHPGGYFVIN